MDLVLPFKIGGLAEYKSFLTGFRGAWFRCKVHNMRVNKSSGLLEYYLEYIDYTEEKNEWVSVFEKNPRSSNQNSRELMLRPSFPRWYYGHEVPEQFTDNDVTVVVDEAWKVGDLVDWFNEGCYWSGTITKLLDEDMMEVKLPAPPIGEGERYRVNCNDLRPTLEWSLIEESWRVPLSKAKKKSWHAARLIQHSKSEPEDSSSDDEYGDNGGGVQLLGCRVSNMPQGSSVVLAPPSDSNSASSPKAQEDGNPSAENLKPSSTSKSPDPNHDTQSAATSSQPAGTGVTVSIKQEPGIGISIKHEKQDTLEAKLKGLMERMQVEQERSIEVLAFCRGSSKDGK